MNARPRIAFYAPLKPPSHGNPSGDRLIAHRLLHTLDRAGFEVELASRLRSYDRSGNSQRQQRIDRLGERLATRLIRRYQRLPPTARPSLWFTYHLYHKAPDWIGPRVCTALSIPYVVAEASYAAKQQNGPWHIGLSASAKALRQADLLIGLNPQDNAGVHQIAPDTPLLHLAPFLDLDALAAAPPLARATLAQRYGLDPARTWLISVAMMRPGDKEHSYRLLAAAMRYCRQRNWQLLLVGSGRAEAQVRAAFAGLPGVHFVGQLPPEQLYPLLRAADLMVWPAVNEAFGMALLEAQALGTWVLAGDEGGVSSLVVPGESGTLVPPRNPIALARALDGLLEGPLPLSALGQRAQAWCARHHDEVQAVEVLRTALHRLLADRNRSA